MTHFRCNGAIKLHEVIGARQGLGKRFEFRCVNEGCHNLTFTQPFDSTPKSGRRYNINCQLVLGARSIGVGHRPMLKFLSVLNLQTLARTCWTEKTKQLEELSIDMREETCERARKEAAATAQSNQSSAINNDGSTNVATGFDGSWKQRGWTSTQGFVSAVSQDTSKVMDVHHMTNSCRYCTSF